MSRESWSKMPTTCQMVIRDHQHIEGRKENSRGRLKSVEIVKKQKSRKVKDLALVRWGCNLLQSKTDSVVHGDSLKNEEGIHMQRVLFASLCVSAP